MILRDTPAPYILRVHGIIPASEFAPQEDEGQIVATQYSFLNRSVHLKEISATEQEISQKELLLHFKDFECMGERFDATLVPICDIVEVYVLGPYDTLQYVVDIPPS